MSADATIDKQLARDKQLSRNVFAFGLASLFNDTASEMAYWILPAFLVSIGVGPAALGVIEGIAESVASFGKLFSGFLADRLQRRKPLVAGGYVVANAAKPFLALATQWWHVLLIRFSDRMAKGIRSTPRDVMLAESLAQKKLGAGFGFQQAMDSAGAVLGPLVAIALIGRIGARGVFWAAAVPGAIAALIIIFGVRERERVRFSVRETKKVAPELSLGGGRLPASFFYVLAAVTLFSLGNSSDMFLVLRAENVGIAAAYAPLLGLVFNITYTAAAWPFGSLSDRVPKRVIAAAGYLVFAATYFAFARATSHRLIWGAMAFYGLFYALTNAVLRALVAESVPAEVRGRALGLFAFCTSIAVLLSSILTGELWKHYGAALPFYLSASLATLAALMLLGQRVEHTAAA